MNTPHDPVPYDGELTDDEPQRYVVMSRSWLKFCLGACERLLQSSAWEETDDVDAATSQALDMMARLLGTEVPPMADYPAVIHIPIHAFRWLASGDPVDIVYASQWLNFIFRQATNFDGQNVAEVVVGLAAGDYLVGWHGVGAGNAGMFRWYVNDVPADYPWALNTYSDPLQYNMLATIEHTIPTDGLYTWRMRVEGKHPSSTGYQIRTTSVIWRKVWW